MGSVCANEQRVFTKLDEYVHPLNVGSKFIHARGRHSRFGNIQKIRTRKNDVYKLIMATNDAKIQTVSIECRIMESTAQFELYDGTKFELQDRMVSPLIDLFNPNEEQIYHPIKTQTRILLTLKAYPFNNYSDNALKRGIYEIWVYNQLRSGSPLVDHFIMTRAKASTLVMIFRKFEVSLLEILQYRKMADYHWTEAELVTLWKILISSYKNMKNLSICHRDIRLGKIFYTSDNRGQPFQFANMDTARTVRKGEQSDLLTVVGVSLFAQSPMRQNIENKNEVASYDPVRYDLDCLVRVLLSLLNLDPLQSKSLACRNEKLSPIVEKLRNESDSLDQIERDLDTILRSMRQDKNELYSVDKIISEHLTKSELRRKNANTIQNAYFNTLLQLHKKEAFNKVLLQRMEENEGINKKQNNVALLHKVGEYYANVGIQKNQYFQEEYRLLLDLTQECREEEFYTDQDQYLSQLRQLQQFISKDNLELAVRYYNQFIYKFIAQNRLDVANQHLSTLLHLSLRYTNIHINSQVQILLTKARLQIADKKLQAAEVTVEKLGQVVGSNNFQTVYDAKRYLGELEHLRGVLEIQVMRNNRDEIKKKRIALAETSLSSALTIFSNLPESNSNTAKIVNTYIARSDLGTVKEDFPEARKNLESADILLTEMEKQTSVSDHLKQEVLQRMKTIYQLSNKLNQPAYRSTLDRLSKLSRQSEQSNASRHQRSKQLRSQQRIRTKQERKVANQPAIEQLLEEDES